MAFGINKAELNDWKEKALRGDVAFLTHFWYDERFPQYDSVTKVACADIAKLLHWGKKYGLKKEWLHNRQSFPHFDLLGERQLHILKKEGKYDHIERFIYKNKKRGASSWK